MSGNAAPAMSGGARWRLPALRSTTLPLAILGGLLTLQFALIFGKSFNWDEFLHYAMVYQLRDGTLSRPMQTLLARVLSWAPYTSSDLIAQMMAARVFVWSLFLVGLAAIYGVARQFAPREDALWATLAYAAAGNVFAHGFAIRTDPIAMAMLMSSLYLLAARRIGLATALAAGILLGAAGMLTVKSVFFAPCFAGIAWLRLSRADDKRGTAAWLCAVPLVAAATFASIYLLHRAGLAPAPASQQGGAFVANGLQWLTQGLLRQPGYTLLAIATAPMFVLALVMAPSAWRAAGVDRSKAIALVGLCLPLLSIVFYRNVFPYFFAFILAPAAVALAPSIARLRARFGTALVAVAIVAVPLVEFVTEPRDVLQHQRAIIDYVHREIPAGWVSFDYSGMVADYPRVVDHLVSGLGIANYRKRGIPLVARAVEQGRLAFVIDNRAAISLALAGQESPDGLLAQDVAALHGNFVRAWGNLWLPGENVPAGERPVTIDVPAAGSYVADAALVVDQIAHAPGDAFALTSGRHVVAGARARPTVLWRGNRLPALPEPSPPTELFTQF